MPEYTPNYNLEKPLGTELYNVGVNNRNMDDIDSALKNTNDTLMLELDSKADQSELGLPSIQTGLATPSSSAGTAVRTNVFYYQVFEAKHSGIFKKAVVRIVTATVPMRVMVYELNEDNTFKSLILEKYIPVVTGLNTVDIGFAFSKGSKYAIGQITDTAANSTAVQRLNAAGIGLHEDDYIKVLGRISNSDPVVNPDYWMYFFSWDIDTTLQSQLDYFKTNGAASLPTIIASSVAPPNPVAGTIWIEV